MNLLKLIPQNFYFLTHHLLTKQKRPFLASYKLTYSCNLRCAQCSFYALPATPPSFSLVQSTLNQLYQRGNRIVIFEGGEPMSWRDHSITIHDVVRTARGRFFCTGITTNGTYPLDVERPAVG
jgi:MoaA/NifB/PqqE/SkfB family radical SAM enzyme